MAEFPSTPIPSYALIQAQRYRTTVSAFDGGAEQRRRRQLFPRFDVSLRYEGLTLAEFRTLRQFHQARSGAWEEFYFYALEADDWTGLYVATGDGTTQIVDLPGKATSDQAIYCDNVEQETGWEILTGGGEASADRVSFTEAPGSGVIVTCDLTGLLRIRCRFAEDNLFSEWYDWDRRRAAVELKGL